MVKSLERLSLCGAERSIKARLRTDAQDWLDEIMERKNQLRATNPKDWNEAPEDVKLEFVKLIGAEGFIRKFFNLTLGGKL